jgi:hypothetical protein
VTGIASPVGYVITFPPPHHGKPVYKIEHCGASAPLVKGPLENCGVCHIKKQFLETGDWCHSPFSTIAIRKSRIYQACFRVILLHIPSY